MRTPDRPTLSCSSCARCPTEDCPARDETQEPRLRGRSLGLAAIGLFISPVVLAVLGALCVRGGEGAQLVGALVGLVLAMLGAALWVRFLLRPRRRGARTAVVRVSGEGETTQ
jgi:hypothetical protein